jgi:pimeloyl-ACP methyl ester carboxylesterase
MSTHSISIEPQGHFWNWRSEQIYTVRAGKARADLPPLLLVHGFGASTDHWRKTVEPLSQTFEVYAIDLIGFGRSAKPKIEYSGNLWRDQLHDFITEEIGRPTILVGNSLGGYACLCVAAERPESAAGLVLLNSAGPFTDSQPIATSSPIQTWIGQSIRSLLLQPWASFLLFQYLRRRSVIRKTLEKVYLDRSAITDQLVEDIYRPSCDRGAAQVFAAVFKSRQGSKVDELLNRMSCPLLMLWGEGDPWMNAQTRAAQFRQYYPNLTEHFLPAGHCPHDEVPEQVTTLLHNWVLSTLTDEDKVESLTA